MTTTITEAAAAADLPDAVRGHLDYLIWAWPSLVEFRLHGTELPWSEPTAMLEHLRAERERLAKLERLERVGLAPGERPVPLRLQVLDLMHRVVTVTSDVVRTVSEVAGAWPHDAAPPALDPRSSLEHVRAVVDLADSLDDRTVPWVAGQLAPLVSAVARTLGDVLEGQVLAALCPWCGGRGPDGAEGLRTLRVHYPEHGGDGQPVVVCHGTGCNPPKLARAGRRDGQPAWAQHDWPWLAARLEELP